MQVIETRLDGAENRDSEETVSEDAAEFQTASLTVAKRFTDHNELRNVTSWFFCVVLKLR
jgi:hypothetical protein